MPDYFLKEKDAPEVRGIFMILVQVMI